MGTRWPETCWATYKGEINIILKVTSSWSLYPQNMKLRFNLNLWFVLYFSLLKSQGSSYVYNKLVVNNNYYNKFNNFIINREMPDEISRTVNVTLNPPSDQTISTTPTNSHFSSHKEEFRFHYKEPPLTDGFFKWNGAGSEHLWEK